MGYYIIKTKEGEFVKTYARTNIWGKPEEFSEFIFDARSWKAHEVEIVEYPDRKLGQCRTYKYLNTKIEFPKDIVACLTKEPNAYAHVYVGDVLLSLTKTEIIRLKKALESVL